MEHGTALALQKLIKILQKYEQLKLVELVRVIIEKYSALSNFQGRESRNDGEAAKLAIEEQKGIDRLQIADER